MAARRGTDLDGHLVGGAADPAALDLELGLGVLDGPLEHGDGVAVAAVLDHVEGLVDDPLGQAALAALEHLVDDLGDQHGPVDRVGSEVAAGGGSFAGHALGSL